MDENDTPPQVIVRGSSPMQHQARNLLQQAAKNTVLCGARNAGSITRSLQRIDTIFSDLDGTLIYEGASAFSPILISYVRRLQDAGMRITFVSGRPYYEIMPLMNTLPSGLTIGVLYEKGAYQLLPEKDGAYAQKILLGSHGVEQLVAHVRGQFLVWQRSIEEKYNAHNLWFGWAGSGTQKSVLSIDVFAGHTPKDYASFMGSERDALKLKDVSLLKRIEQELAAFVHLSCSGWQLVNLGNGNFEIAPPGLEKDKAIQQTPEFKHAKGVLVLGD